MKSGWKTSEFWLTLMAMMLGGFVAAGVVPTTHWAMNVAGIALTLLGSMGYTAARAKVKAALPSES